jgi:N-acetylneuraminic acid mutarotase
LKIKFNQMKIYGNHLAIGLLSVVLFFTSFSCHKSSSTVLVGNWVEQSDFEGVARSSATAFSINDYGFVGLGYDGEVRLKDFWSYDPGRNSWTQVAAFPGIARNSAVGFSAAGKGFVGLGYDGESKLKDFWQYDPGANKWDSVNAPNGPSARYGAVAFSIGDIGYVGTGYDGNYLKDFWAYNPGDNTWTQKTSFGGSKRRDAVAFVLADKGYICTGINNGNYEREFYMYDPGSDTWTAKRKIYNSSDESYDNDYAIVRSNAVAFVIGNKAYIATGAMGSLKSDVWEYDPATDLWEPKTNFEGSARQDAVSFSIAGRGYVTTGKSSTYQFDDIWEFLPLDDYNKED